VNNLSLRRLNLDRRSRLGPRSCSLGRRSSQPIADSFRAELTLSKDRPPGFPPGGPTLHKLVIANSLAGASGLEPPSSWSRTVRQNHSVVALASFTRLGALRNWPTLANRKFQLLDPKLAHLFVEKSSVNAK
jgi:hypothetical protein